MAEETLADFYVEGKHRSFRIIVGEKTFYVNGHFLGEISSFFDAAFFGGFAEAREKLVTLVDEEADDVASFLEVVHFYGSKKITGSDGRIVVRLLSKSEGPRCDGLKGGGEPTATYCFP
uniref:BTB domain-containing protein n=1 Tax=Angiostrongylus cantonensis TaxID=6313 RepID=A0A158PCD0_ANGCA